MSKKHIKAEYLHDSMRYYGYFRTALVSCLNERVTATRIADTVGTSKPTISGIKSGRVKPSMQLQIAIARCLGYDYLDFLAKGRALVADTSLLDKMQLRLKRFADITTQILSKDNAQSTALETVLNSLYRDMEFAEYPQPSGLIDKSSGGGVTAKPIRPEINIITSNGRR